MKKLLFILIGSTILMNWSCKSAAHYKMFQTENSIVVDSIEKLRKDFTIDYKLKAYDHISFQVFTNKGEAIIDPNKEITNSSSTNMNVEKKPDESNFFILDDKGNVNLPMLGSTNLLGLTIFQLDSVLTVKYNAYYVDAYVKSKLLTRRVVVFGPEGGKVIMLPYLHMNFIEVLATYGDFKNRIDARKFKLIRGDLSNPDVQVIDLHTIDGMRKAQLDVQNGDIIYCEYKRDATKEVISYILPIAQIMTALTTLAILIISVKSK
jgi:polysaccharide export outer membrane protein